MEPNWLLERLMYLMPLLLSLSVHEWAHAWSAWKLGDDTAARMGRMTLNPIEHIDPVGTLLLPLLGVPFGWAKPVPINPMRFNRNVTMRAGIVLTAAAGPISNILLALGFTGLMAVLLLVRPGIFLEFPGLAVLFHHLVVLNWILALFNALPIPPLDGSRVVDGLLPDRARPAWDSLSAAAPVLLIAVIVVPLFLGFSPLGWVANRVELQLSQLVAWLGAG